MYQQTMEIQRPGRKLEIESSDGIIIHVDADVVDRYFLPFKQMFDLEDISTDENDTYIQIPQNGPHISGAILRTLIYGLPLYQRNWETFFLQVDRETLFELMRAADYLNVEDVFKITCNAVATLIKGMTAKNIRLTFNIPNDLGPAEEKKAVEIRKWSWYGENCWRSPLPGRIVNMNLNDANWNNEDGNAIADCLRNHYIVGKICDKFSNAELLELSCVNELWSFEARRLIILRGNFIARIPNRECQKYFDLFGARLGKMKDVLFSGLLIELFASDHDGACSTGTACSIPNIVITGLSWKCLKFLVHENWFDFPKCPSYLLAKCVLRDFCGQLEELVVEIHTGREEFVKKILQIGDNIVQESIFSALKIFKLEGSYVYSAPYENCSIMEALAGRAPNLNQLHIGAMLAVALMLQDFNFNQAFPKLSTVLVFGQDSLLKDSPLCTLIAEANASLGEPLRNAVARVWTLEIVNLHESSVIIKFFARMFPNIWTLHADRLTVGALRFWSDCYRYRAVRPRGIFIFSPKL